MLRSEKQSISYRLSDIHIHYVHETDSSSHTETYIYVAHIDYIAHNAQEMKPMATYTKQANGITTAISIGRAAEDSYISVQIRSHKGLEIIEGAHIWIPVTEFQKLCEAAIKEAEQSA